MGRPMRWCGIDRAGCGRDACVLSVESGDGWTGLKGASDWSKTEKNTEYETRDMKDASRSWS